MAADPPTHLLLGSERRYKRLLHARPADLRHADALHERLRKRRLEVPQDSCIVPTRSRRLDSRHVRPAAQAARTDRTDASGSAAAGKLAEEHTRLGAAVSAPLVAMGAAMVLAAVGASEDGGVEPRARSDGSERTLMEAMRSCLGLEYL